MSTSAVIQLRQCFSQCLGCIRRVVGLMPAKYMVSLIDELDLDANPRSSKLGSVTDAIQKSIRSDESSNENLFPFKSKGILVATSYFEELDRSRFRLSFQRPDIEGILDGGHNTLAIGCYIYTEAEKALGKPAPRKSDIDIWDHFKLTWREHREDIAAYLQLLRDDKATLLDSGVGVLDFMVPVELLLPSDPDDECCIDDFRSSLLEICDARNNNAQLTQGTKGNQEGLFDTFRALLTKKNPALAEKVSWKTNDGGTVQSRILISLAWIPLSLLQITQKGGVVEAPSMVSIYSGKEKCLERYLQLMRSDEVTISMGSARRELKNTPVESALEITTDLPLLFDRIYQLFPKYYNLEGSYGKIGAIKSLKNKKGEYPTPFCGVNADDPVPDGYIYPLICSLRALMDVNPENGTVSWGVDPWSFVDGPAFKEVVRQYSGVIKQSDYDPQKVGKGTFSYTSAENSVKLARFFPGQ